jgi:hypothetical protein
MRTGRITAAVAFAVVCGSIGAPKAWGIDYLSGDELKSTMTGLTLDFLPRNGQPIRHTYTDKGTFFEYVFRGEKNIHINSVGKWWIEDDTLVCVQDNRPNREKLCRKYAIEDEVLKQYTVNGVLTPDPMAVIPK